MIKLALLFIVLINVAESRKITIYNRCPMTIWPAIQGPGNPAGGGFELNPEESRDIHVDHSWPGGRIWARTDCDSNFNCKTGFCGNNLGCQGMGGIPPATLAEFTLNGYEGRDFYDVSLVDGYNLPVLIEPHGGHECKRAGGCHKDVNQICPEEFSIKNSDGRTVACKSACLKYNTDVECCRGDYNHPDICNPIKTRHIFKNACPTASSYAYDAPTSLFTCQNIAEYVVQFC